MRRSVVALLMLGCLGASPVSASEPTPGVLVDWSGVYVGGHIGYGWSNVDLQLQEPKYAVAILDYLHIPTGANNDVDGVLGGGHIGLQRQWGSWVFGVEGAYSFGNLDGRSSEEFVKKIGYGHYATELAGNVSFKTSIEDIASVAARLGYARDRWLAYVKGGFATAHIETKGSINGEFCKCIDFSGSASTGERHNGWVLGAGLEYMIKPNLIVGFEYNYMDLGAKTHTGSGYLDVHKYSHSYSFSHETKLRVDPDAIHTVMARLSYKFGHREPEHDPLK